MKRSHSQHRKTTCHSTAFTLVELVVVVLVLGIIASAAGASFIDISGQARDNGLRQSLKVVRDAIELYKVQNDGAFPGGGGGVFKSALNPYLKGPFPTAPVGPKEGRRSVKVENEGNPLEGSDDPERAWLYDKTTGEFILNFDGVSSDGVTCYDDF